MPITCAEFSPDSSYILTNGKDNMLRVVDTRTFNVVTSLEPLEYRSAGNFNRVCWSADSRKIVAGGANGTVFMWDAITGRLDG